jgi:hypothetical protein
VCDGEEKILLHYLCRESNPGRPARSPVTILTELLGRHEVFFPEKKRFVIKDIYVANIVDLLM